MKKRLILILLTVVLMIGAIIAVFFFWSVSNETLNSYVEKLRAKGEKVTFEEMIASLSPHTNNSLAILTNIIQQIGAPLGDATNVEVMDFIGPGRAHVAWKQSHPTWIVSASRSTNVSWADLGDSVTRMTTPLTELRQAVKQPAPNAGFRTNYFQKVTPFREVKIATYWLASEALWNLHEGRSDEALASVQAIASLTDLHREEYSLISQMTRAAVASLGLNLTWEALQTKEWSDEQLLLLQKCWEGKDFLEMAEKGMEGERCMARESLKRMQEENPMTAKRFSDSYYGTNFLDHDLLFQLRHVQGYIEQVRALRTNLAWSEVSVSLDRFNARIEELTNSPQRFRFLMTLLSTPNFKRAVSTSVRRETERRLVIIVIALKRYENKHGQFPPSLDTLVPESFAAVPRDCMNGEPLRYQSKNKNSFTLYSVGEDGQDNGGDPSPTKSNGKPGLWEGRDAVWPAGTN